MPPKSHAYRTSLSAFDIAALADFAAAEPVIIGCPAGLSAEDREAGFDKLHERLALLREDGRDVHCRIVPGDLLGLAGTWEYLTISWEGPDRPHFYPGMAA